MPAEFAKLFANGRSQAVRLPRGFRFSGTTVRVSRHGRGVLLEPVIENPTDWFAEMDKHADDTFLEEGRDQPPTPERDMFD